MSTPDFAARTRSGVVWSTLSFAGTKAFTFISTLVLARLLVPSQFGVVAAVLTFLAVLDLFSDVGMAATVVYEMEEGHSERLDTAFVLNLLFALAMSGIAVAAAPLVAGFFRIPHETWLFRLGGLNLFLTGLGNIHDSLLLREHLFNRRMIPQLARSIVRGGVSIVLAAVGRGAAGLVIGMLAGTAVWSVMQWLLTRYRPRLKFDPKVARSMLSYGSGAVMLELLAIVAGRADAAAIGRVLGARALGLYTIAFRVPELVIENIAWNVSVVAFPALSRQRVEDRSRLGDATMTLLRYQALYTVPLATALAVLAPPMVVVLFSPAWRQAGNVMSAVAVMAGFSSVVFPLGDVFKALGRQRLLVAINLLQVPLLIAGVILAAPAGIVAVGWVRAGEMALHAMLTTFVVTRVVSIPLRNVVRAVWPAAAAAAGVGLGAGAIRLALPELSIVPLALGGAAGLLGGVIALRALAPAGFFELVSQLAALRPRMARSRVAAAPTAGRG
jgi:PST family polysaccharide transporter